MALEQEVDTYRREFGRLLQDGHARRWALLKGDHLISVWDTRGDALQYGYERFGSEPFAVKLIDPRDAERLAHVSLDGVAPCQS
jgi:hypothetical protein